MITQTVEVLRGVFGGDPSPIVKASKTATTATAWSGVRAREAMTVATMFEAS